MSSSGIRGLYDAIVYVVRQGQQIRPASAFNEPLGTGDRERLARETMLALFAEFGHERGEANLESEVARRVFTSMLRVVRRVRLNAFNLFRTTAREFWTLRSAEQGLHPDAARPLVVDSETSLTELDNDDSEAVRSIVGRWFDAMDTRALAAGPGRGTSEPYQEEMERFVSIQPYSLRLAAARVLEYLVPEVEEVIRRLRQPTRARRSATAAATAARVQVWTVPTDFDSQMAQLTYVPRATEDLLEHLNNLLLRAWPLTRLGTERFKEVQNLIRQALASDSVVIESHWMLIASLLTAAEAGVDSPSLSVFFQELREADGDAFYEAGGTLLYALSHATLAQRTLPLPPDFRFNDPCSVVRPSDITLESVQRALTRLQEMGHSRELQLSLLRSFYDRYRRESCPPFRSLIQASSLSKGFEVSYISTGAGADPSGSQDADPRRFQLTDDELRFLALARQRSRTNGAGGRREEEKDDDREPGSPFVTRRGRQQRTAAPSEPTPGSASLFPSVEELSDDVRFILRFGERCFAVAERARSMLERPPEEDPADVPPFGRLHGEDPFYYRLFLERYADRPRGQVLPANIDLPTVHAHAARRRWWLRMLALLFNENIEELPAIENAKRFAYEEVYTFLTNPVAFASNETNHVIDTGPPGTGKTTFVRTLAVLYHLLGLYPLGTIDPDATPVALPSNFIAPFEGQTMAKVRDTLLRHLGMFLPIDEAYALVQATDAGGTSEFGQQAVDEMTALLLRFRSLIGLALVGYSGRIYQRLLRANEGLARRFPKRISFSSYTGAEMVDVIAYYLRPVYPTVQLDVPTLQRFFRFLTGEAFESANGARPIQDDAVDSFAYLDEASGEDVILQRGPYAARRSDETAEDYAQRLLRERNAGVFGNIIETENASLAREIVDTHARRRVPADQINTESIIEVARAALESRGYVSFVRNGATVQEESPPGDFGRRGVPSPTATLDRRLGGEKRTNVVWRLHALRAVTCSRPALETLL